MFWRYYPIFDVFFQVGWLKHQANCISIHIISELGQSKAVNHQPPRCAVLVMLKEDMPNDDFAWFLGLKWQSGDQDCSIFSSGSQPKPFTCHCYVFTGSTTVLPPKMGSVEHYGRKLKCHCYWEGGHTQGKRRKMTLKMTDPHLLLRFSPDASKISYETIGHLS